MLYYAWGKKMRGHEIIVLLFATFNNIIMSSDIDIGTYTAQYSFI